MKTILVLIVSLVAMLSIACNCWNYCSKENECGVNGDEGTCRAHCQGDDSKKMDCILDKCDPDWGCERWYRCLCDCDPKSEWNTEYGFCEQL